MMIFLEHIMARYSEFLGLVCINVGKHILGAGCILYYYNSQRVYIMALDSFLGKIILGLPGPFSCARTAGLLINPDSPYNHISTPNKPSLRN